MNNVKWYDKFGRLFSRDFSTIESARSFYRSLCSGDECPIYARLTAATPEGPFVLGEYRPS